MRSSIIQSINFNLVENLSLQELESRIEYSFVVFDPDMETCANIRCDSIDCDKICDKVRPTCDSFL